MFHHIPFFNKPHSVNRKRDYDFGPTHFDLIGSGGYSQVLKARDKTKDGLVVAVKVVPKNLIKDNTEYLKIISTGFDRINKNDNICYPLDWFESSHKFYLVFPLLTGGELLERLNNNGRFTEAAVRRLMLRILDTLAYVHSHNIIHRDIKPDNFIYRSPSSEIDDVVLIDFGIAKILDLPHNTEIDESDPKNQLEVAGTPGYAGPEMFSKTGYGKNQDVFGVGVIAYNLLSATSPWSSHGHQELIEETLEADFTFPEKEFKGVSQLALNFISQLTNPDPHERPSSKRALRHPWLMEVGNIAQSVPVAHCDSPPSSPDQRLRCATTLKPEHPVARILTAGGIQSLRAQ